MNNRWYNRWLGIALLVSALAHVVLWTPTPMLAQALAVLTIAGFLPGALLIEALVGRSASRPDRFERLLYSIAAAFGVMVLVMLLLSYLPGGPTQLLTLLAFDVLTLALILWLWLRRSPAGEPAWPSPGGDQRWLWIGLIVLLAVGSVTRFVGLEYTDFQGDEARAALRAAAVLQGYEDVLMLHKKGPTEILLPTVLYALTGHLTEQTARLPFAIANLAGLLAVFLLGIRLYRPLAGWIAAMLLAFDGYFIGFAHIVQYQSIVFLTSVLTVLVLYRLYTKPAAATNYLTLAAIFLATGMLSHYEGVLPALPAAVLLAATFWRYREQWRTLLGATAIAAAAGALLLGAFYFPYIYHERFTATYTYLTARRIGSSPPYNNLNDVFLRTTLYSTTLQVLLWILLTLLAALRVVRQNFSRTLSLPLSALITLFFGVTLFWPEWFTIGGKDWAVLPFTLVFGLIVLLPRQSLENRVIWLWFSAVMILALFLVEKPRTHVYTFFMPWALIAGNELALLWASLPRHTGTQPAKALGIGAAAVLIVYFGLYAFHFFLSREEVLLNYFEKRPAGYWTPYEEPDNKARFGFPLNNGWKTIGELYRTGVLTGSFETTEKEAWVPAWYTRGAERCRRDAQWFFQIRNLEPWSTQDELAMEHYLRQGFEKWGRVQVNGEDKLIIYKRTGVHQEYPSQAPNEGLPVFRAEEYIESFDRHALADFPLTYPSVDPPIAYPLQVNLGNLITLEGYDIRYEKPLRPGDNIYLTLYWRAQRPIDKSYKVFNQVFFGDGPMVAQRDGYPVCEGRETWRWDPGELITDPYTIPVKDDAPDGLYPLYTGMYLEETFERLPILDEEGNEIGTQVHLTDIRIGEE
ncbi:MULTISPECIES: glycosyltransferase family 39 protein [Caldilinea]|jgi:4-amino-4-deoxy-L-arabinose transferase-like glycosyltransferase|uniref:Glycosyltransferase RgtA/B/C/D-like domain-containing protein n=1 Tax=Caldilinea aerophila (strain DSM 14535 / JCM 11387 / NBRC 104270 / STL-6-O1) TaxID=926550 RepID=I0I7P8_CALAS|nr:MULTISPECIES: glycosyltransferase family 39 protein [Caldilinea]BAM01286.1 hypothetical protein CLDAP_32460 [Caldilinea aerophila DSM 14535 = NBRC 104270]GIV72627.1 MAG: hypothetical protein KatS3mg049_1183 [Caldilinea sp.]